MLNDLIWLVVGLAVGASFPMAVKAIYARLKAKIGAKLP